MKKIRIFATALLLAFTLSSCESFFDVELDDQAKIEDIFRQKTEVQKYLSHLYSYIPQEEEVVGMHGWTVGRSDEALFSWYQWVYYTQFRTVITVAPRPTSITGRITTSASTSAPSS